MILLLFIGDRGLRGLPGLPGNSTIGAGIPGPQGRKFFVFQFIKENTTTIYHFQLWDHPVALVHQVFKVLLV